MEKILAEIYYNPKTGYSSFDKLYSQAKNIDKNIKKKDVKVWLEQQPTYTLHRPARKRYPRNKVLVSAIDEQFQVDLVDLQSLSKYNDNFNYLLTCIDLFSKYAWAVPLKSKHARNIIMAFEEIFQTGRIPVKIQSDQGTEFTNKNFQKYLADKDVDFFTTSSELKASVVERFNRTLKEKMWRYFTKTNTYRYIDILADLLHNYNNSYHRTIKTYPANVTPTNEVEILNRSYRISKVPVIFQFDIGDKVRVSKVRRQFEKSYWPGWSEEYFIIHDRVKRHPPVYKLKDQMNEVLSGIFYEYELQKIKPDTTDLFVIEKIVKTRTRGKKTDYLVKWRGYPSKFNSWVSNLVKL